MRAFPTIFDGEKIVVPDELKGLDKSAKVLLIVEDVTFREVHSKKETHRWSDVLPTYSSGRTGAEIEAGDPPASFGSGPHRMQDVLPAKGSGRTGAEIDAELRAMRDEWDQ